MGFGITVKSGSSIASKGCSTLFFFVFLAAGLAFTGFLAWVLYQTLRPYTWDKVDCVIVSSRAAEIAEGGDEREPYRFEVRYAYSVKGREYVSERVTVDGNESPDFTEVQKLALDYPTGAKAVCYVNPADPSEAVLRRGSFWMGLIVLFPLVFVAIGAGGIWFTWRRRPAAADAPDAPLSRQAVSRTSPWVLPAFFGVFFAFGSVFLYFFFVQPVLRIREARGWTETPCVVLSSQVRSHSDSDGTTYSVDIRYAYTVDGREFKSNTYHFMTGSSSGYDGKKAVVDRYPPGTKTVCYVNPKNPTDAVLDRGFTPEFYFGLLPLVFVLVGAVGMFFSIRYALRKGKEPPGATWLPARARFPRGTLPGDPMGASASGVPAAGRRGGPAGPGPVTLKPGASPVGKFIGVLVMALFWNGIVSVFVWQVVASWRRGDPEWFMAVFMVPFVLVGLFLVGAAAYQFLALFNPRPEITVSAAAVPLGGTVDVAWKVPGGERRIRRFRIRLEGREEATYRRGTSTSTDKSVFCTVDLADARSPYEIRAGRATLTVPAGTMHSFESANNKVVWTLRVTGEIDRWPDVNEEYPIVVLPAGT